MEGSTMHRTIVVTIPVRNPGKTPRTVTFDAGSLIEVTQDGLQHVVVAETVTDSLDPGEKKDIRVRGYCLNHNLSWPDKASGKLTKLTFTGLVGSQNQVWQATAQPDTSVDRMSQIRRELRREMGSLLSLDDLRILTADLGETELRFENIPGETLILKCHELVEGCLRLDILPELLTMLRELRPRSVVFDHIAKEVNAPIPTGVP